MALKLKLDRSTSTAECGAGRDVPTLAEYVNYCAAQSQARHVALMQARTSHTLDTLDLDALRTLDLDEWRAMLDVPSSQGDSGARRLKLDLDTMRQRIRSTPGTRERRDGTKLDLDATPYRGTSSADGMSQHVEHVGMARHTLDATVPLSDVVETLPSGHKLTLRTRSRRVERRTLDDSVSERATLTEYRKPTHVERG